MSSSSFDDRNTTTAGAMSSHPPSSITTTDSTAAAITTSSEDREKMAIDNVCEELRKSLHELWNIKEDVGEALYMVGQLQDNHQVPVNPIDLALQFQTMDTFLKKSIHATQTIIERIHGKVGEVEQL